MTKPQHIVVIGAGVIGLQIAETILDHGYQVTIIAKHLPGDLDIEYTSPWAGAQWRPHGNRNDITSKEWDLATLRRWEELIHAESVQSSTDLKSGLGIYKSIEYCWNVELPWYTEDVTKLRKLDSSTIPDGTRIGFSYDSVMVNVPSYLKYLLQSVKSKGANVIQQSLPTENGLETALETATKLVKLNLDDVTDPSIAIFINASGLGSLKLVPDEAVYPIRGHTITVAGEAKHITTINFKPSSEKIGEDVITYILPRPGSGTTVIGGTKQPNRWDSQPDSETTDELLNRAKPFAQELLDSNGNFTVISAQVGLRPGRKGGSRVEMESIGQFKVCHAYGHAGGGYQNSYGCSLTVLKLINAVCK